MPDSVKDIGDEGVVAAVEKIQGESDDAKSRQLEAEQLEQTENGWQEGDPAEQPAQMVELDEGAPAG